MDCRTCIRFSNHQLNFHGTPAALCTESHATGHLMCVIAGIESARPDESWGRGLPRSSRRRARGGKRRARRREARARERGARAKERKAVCSTGGGEGGKPELHAVRFWPLSTLIVGYSPHFLRWYFTFTIESILLKQRALSRTVRFFRVGRLNVDAASSWSLPARTTCLSAQAARGRRTTRPATAQCRPRSATCRAAAAFSSRRRP